MPGKKQRSVYRGKRKGKGFAGALRKRECVEKKAAVERGTDGFITSDTSHMSGSDSVEESLNQPLSSSRKKMKSRISVVESSGSSDEEKGDKNTIEYRLIDVKNLSSVFSTVHKCKD